uniref:Uncharacterized protein n=1 Tax=Picea sitchensis TaxID=3332 RepID=A9NSS4_PICSI|nr:unknown [Picea sitchensis]
MKNTFICPRLPLGIKKVLRKMKGFLCMSMWMGKSLCLGPCHVENVTRLDSI